MQAQRVSHIREETANNTTILALRDVIMHGWPEKKSDYPAYLHAYWNYRDEFTVADGLILKGTRIVIPGSLQAHVLKQLLYAHQGAEKCKLRAKGHTHISGQTLTMILKGWLRDSPHASVARS